MDKAVERIAIAVIIASACTLAWLVFAFS